MGRTSAFILFYLAVFLQAGAYGLTFMLPELFDALGADEKAVGTMLMLTAVSTLATVYFVGHLSDRVGRIKLLAVGCFAIAMALASYGWADRVGVLIGVASLLLGFGWGITYALCPVVLTRLVMDEYRVRFFTLLSIAVMAGFGLSPVLAAFLVTAGQSVSSAFFLTAFLCLVSAAIFLGVESSIKAHALNAGPETRSKITLSAIGVIVNSRAWRPVIMVFIGASVFAGVTNFQTVYADERGLNYADYFLVYTFTVVLFRLVLARFSGGRNPYLTISLLQYVMCGGVVLFCFTGGNELLYWAFAILFGIGYGVSYPILIAVTAKDAHPDFVAQTLQLFAFTYFGGIFGFPLIAGWMIVDLGSYSVLALVAAMAGIEASLALHRAITA